MNNCCHNRASKGVVNEGVENLGRTYLFLLICVPDKTPNEMRVFDDAVMFLKREEAWLITLVGLNRRAGGVYEDCKRAAAGVNRLA